jgi:hypothetical protein
MKETLRHIDERIASAKIGLWPYPHVVVPEIFPRDVYAAMQADLPDKQQFLGELAYMAQMGRFEFGPKPEERDVARLWHERYYSLVTHLNAALIDKFAPFIATNMKRLHAHGVISTDNVPLVPGQATFCYMESGWAQPPHVHSLGEILQSFVYFPVAGSTKADNRNLGTIMCRFKRSVDWPLHDPDAKPTCDEENTERVVQAPYADNLLFCFLNTAASPHVAPLVRGAKDRQYLFMKVALPIQMLTANAMGRVASDAFLFEAPSGLTGLMAGLKTRLRGYLPEQRAGI